MRAQKGQGFMRRIVSRSAAAAMWLLASYATAQGAPEDPDAVTEEDASADAGKESLDRDESVVAAEEHEAARGHFRVGGLLYDEGRFRDAAEEFRKAYALSGKPELLYNMYIAYRDAGLTEEAVESLRGYLDEAPEVAERRKLEVRLSAMEETLEASRAPTAEETAAAEAAATPATPATDAEAEVEPRRSTLPWILAGVGAGLIVTGSVTGLMALSRTGDIEDACPNGVCPADYPLDRERDRARRLALTTDVLLPVGAAALGVGVLLYFLLNRDDTAQRPVEANASCGPGGCSGELRMRF
jgi:tetratricopeptide (TPR) repeat protein